MYPICHSRKSCKKSYYHRKIKENDDLFRTAEGIKRGEPFQKPIFYGLPILTQDGLIFGDVPEKIMSDLNRGKTGMEIALEQLHSYVNNGMFGIYIVPPIQKGGRRDYESVAELIREFSETS